MNRIAHGPERRMDFARGLRAVASGPGTGSGSDGMLPEESSGGGPPVGVADVERPHETESDPDHTASGNAVSLEDPNRLRPHPLTAEIPRPDDAELAALTEDVSRHGVLVPLSITSDGLVVDGERRRQAALRAGLASVPVRMIGEDDVTWTVLRGLCLSRTLTVTIKAFIATEILRKSYGINGENGVCGKGVHSVNTCVHSVNTTSDLGGEDGPSLREMSARLGIALGMLSYASRVVEIFAAHPDLRDRFRPAILSGEMGLGAVLKALGSLIAQRERAAAGVPHPGGPPAELERRAALLLRGERTMLLRISRDWSGLDEAMRREHWRELRSHLDAMSHEDCLAVAEYHARVAALARRRARAAECAWDDGSVHGD